MTLAGVKAGSGGSHWPSLLSRRDVTGFSTWLDVNEEIDPAIESRAWKVGEGGTPFDLCGPVCGDRDQPAAMACGELTRLAGSLGYGDGTTLRCVGAKRGVPGTRCPAVDMRDSEKLAEPMSSASMAEGHGDGGKLSIVGPRRGVSG